MERRVLGGWRVLPVDRGGGRLPRCHERPDLEPRPGRRDRPRGAGPAARRLSRERRAGGNGTRECHVGPDGAKIAEGFGPAYQLSNAHCSNETCGSIGLLLLDWRLLALTGDARYADSAERILYNTFLAGVGLEGKTYFYTNPLRRFGAEGVFSEDDTMIRWMHRAGGAAPRTSCESSRSSRTRPTSPPPKDSG